MAAMTAVYISKEIPEANEFVDMGSEKGRAVFGEEWERKNEVCRSEALAAQNGLQNALTLY